MPYAVRFQAEIFWVGAGAGPMEAVAAVPSLPGTGGGNGQSKAFQTNPAALPIVPGSGSGTAPNQQLASADITALTNAVAADMAAQMNAVIATMQGWTTGQP